MNPCKTVALAGLAALYLTAGAHAAEDTVLARVNGTAITEADVASAEAEVGSELARIPEQDRRRVLVEHLIETHLLAEAAKKEKLDQGPQVESRMKYYRQGLLRTLFLEKRVGEEVTEAQAKQFYDEQVAKIEPEMEVRARHILVETEEEARDIIERLNRDDDFAELAKEKSKDTGSGENGGDLGYFTRDRMVKEFADAAFALEVGAVSEPIESQFGWHVIKVEDKRQRQLASFDSVKDQIMAALVQKKVQDVIRDLRDDAQVEFVDPELKKAAEEAATPEAPAKPADQQ